jgi:hypothetical protein
MTRPIHGSEACDAMLLQVTRQDRYSSPPPGNSPATHAHNDGCESTATALGWHDICAATGWPSVSPGGWERAHAGGMEGSNTDRSGVCGLPVRSRHRRRKGERVSRSWFLPAPPPVGVGSRGCALSLRRNLPARPRRPSAQQSVMPFFFRTFFTPKESLALDLELSRTGSAGRSRHTPEAPTKPWIAMI